MINNKRPIKILIAPDSFKGSLDASEVCDAIAAGVINEVPDAIIIKNPMADGGEGTVQSIVDAQNGQICVAEVSGPLGNIVTAKYGIINKDTAIIEMAEASGLTLISTLERNPLLTTTFGTGELILDAINNGCKNIIIGVGGSATNDGGAGMAQALGFSLLDKNKDPIQRGGQGLAKLDSIHISTRDKRLDNCSFTVACDVNNIFCGENGASIIYGPQKGATPEMIKTLDSNLGLFAKIIYRDIGKDISTIPGSGAAGGLAGGLMAFLNAKLSSGVDIVKKETNLSEKMSEVDLVFTGEGKCDHQTLEGKTVLGVAELAKSLNIPVIAIVGSIGEDIEDLYNHGITEIVSIMKEPHSLEYAMENASTLITETTERILHLMT